MAAQLVVDFLTAHLPLALWSVTRVENGRPTLLYLNEDNGYGRRPAASHPWADSFCIHMVAARTPSVAPDAQSVPAYAAAGVNWAATIGAYAGAAIYEADGALFGAICGLDPVRRVDDVALAAVAPLLALLGQLLTMVLAADPINDSAGHSAGDRYIAAAGTAIRGSGKSSDFVARLGGGEFGVLMGSRRPSPGRTPRCTPRRRPAGPVASARVPGLAWHRLSRCLPVPGKPAR